MYTITLPNVFSKDTTSIPVLVCSSCLILLVLSQTDTSHEFPYHTAISTDPPGPGPQQAQGHCRLVPW